MLDSLPLAIFQKPTKTTIEKIYTCQALEQPHTPHEMFYFFVSFRQDCVASHTGHATEIAAPLLLLAVS